MGQFAWRLCLLLGLSMCVGVVSADPVLLFDEEDDGEGNQQDLSNDPFNPTSIGVLPLGDGLVRGVVVTTSSLPEDADADIFTFRIAENMTLDSVVVTFPGNRHFFGLDEGPTSVDVNTGRGSDLLIATLIGGTTGNLLDLPSNQQTFGGTGAGGQLGPGDYTIWLQENMPGAHEYSLVLTTSASAIPEPSSVLALLGLSGGIMIRRPRRESVAF